MPEWDRLHKLAFELETVEMLRICGVDVAGCDVEALPTDYLNDIRADRVYRVGDAVIHIEVQPQRDVDLERRLVHYWAVIVKLHAVAPRQIVLLPRGGRYDGLYELGGLTLRYEVVDVRRCDPEVLAAGPLAPLALLAASDPARYLVPVADCIQEVAAEKQRSALIDLAFLALADDDDLTRTLVAELRRRNMALRNTEVGQELLTEGRAAGRAEAVRYLLTERFGEDPRIDVAVAALTEMPFVEAAERIKTAADLADLIA